MIREILTLVVDKVPTQYYINFEKDRKRFSFQPTLKNKAAPVFVISVEEGSLVCEESIDDALAAQAKEKVKELLSTEIFNRF